MSEGTKAIEDNLFIWKEIQTTPPEHTKKVAFGGRKFTSVDAYWQIQRMTELFGPCGIGWGYETTSETVQAGYSGYYGLAVVHVTLWYRYDGEKVSYGPVTSASEYVAPRTESGGGIIFDKQGRPVERIDCDAWKKAMTDALTKAMSHIGMSADVFLGCHDDSRYVQHLRETGEPPPPADALISADHLLELKKMLEEKGRTMEAFLGFLRDGKKRQIETEFQLTEEDYESARSILCK